MLQIKTFKKKKKKKKKLDSEILVPSTMEYLYSFRDTIDSPLPNFNSENAHRAFKKLLEIKEKVSSSKILI